MWSQLLRIGLVLALALSGLGVARLWADGQEATQPPAAVEYPLALRDVLPPEGDGNPIDRLLAPYLSQHKILLSPVVSDERFARRVSLDLVGLPLSPDHLKEFLADARPDKRDRLVRRLLADQENYVAHWMTFWSDHLRIGSGIDAGAFDNDNTKGPQEWLQEQLQQDIHYDRFVRELIAGDFFEKYARSIAPQGEIASAVDLPEMQVATTISQVFLGIQLKCASCHDSFVDRWTLQDAWGLASALGDEPFELYRCQVPLGDKAAARFPLAGLGEIDAQADKQKRRRQVAELMTDPQNGLFARTIVNRLWARLLGRGLVEPLDEMMEHEPWNADLLDWLAAELIRKDHDLKQILFLIMTSRAYQSPAVVRQQPLVGEEYVFQGPEIRWLSAEQFIDSLLFLQRNELDQPSPHAPATRAWQHANDRLMTMLGRPGRDVVVTTRGEEATPLLALELINGEKLEELVEKAAEAQLKQRGGGTTLLMRVYQSLLGREPTVPERNIGDRVLGSTPNQQTVTDLIWTLIMLPEFQLVP